MLRVAPPYDVLVKPLAGIPIAVIIATLPDRMRGTSGAVTRLQIQRAQQLALSLPDSILVTANHVGHAVHERDPALVARLVHHVLTHAAGGN
jgi:pimeloyl-ACP methyl ester carboxylesterase